MTSNYNIGRMILVFLFITIFYSCDFDRKDPTSNPDKVAKMFFEIVKNGDEAGFKKYFKKGVDYNSDLFSRSQRDFRWKWEDTKYLTCDIWKTNVLDDGILLYKGDYIVIRIYFQDIKNPVYRAYFVVKLERAEDGKYYISRFTFLEPIIE